MNFHSLSKSRPLGLATLATAVTATVAAAILVFQAPVAQADATPAAPPAMPVSVAPVLQKDIALWDEFSGRLEAVQRVDVRPRVSGAVQAVHFREGSLVKQGDLLFTVDPAPYAAEVDRAEAQVVAAQARVSYTRSELERATRLLEEKAIAQREHDESAWVAVTAQRAAVLLVAVTPSVGERSFDNRIGKVGKLPCHRRYRLAADDVAIGDPHQLPALESPQGRRDVDVNLEGQHVADQFIDQRLARDGLALGHPQQVVRLAVHDQQVAEILTGRKNLQQIRQRLGVALK